jgi:F0F1-type ATP synthase gamma subunit
MNQIDPGYRGLAGAYNGNVLRAPNAFIRQQQAAGKTVELELVAKRGSRRLMARGYLLRRHGVAFGIGVLGHH